MNYFIRKKMMVFMLLSVFQVKCSVDNNELDFERYLSFLDEEEQFGVSSQLTPIDGISDVTTDLEPVAFAGFFIESANKTFGNIASLNCESGLTSHDSPDNSESFLNLHEKIDVKDAEQEQQIFCTKNKKAKKKKKTAVEKLANEVTFLQAAAIIEAEEKAKKEEARRAQQRKENAERVAAENARVEKDKRDKRDAFKKEKEIKQQKKLSRQLKVIKDQQSHFEQEMEDNLKIEQIRHYEAGTRYLKRRADYDSSNPVENSYQIQVGLPAEERAKQEIVVEALRAEEKIQLDCIFRTEDCVGRSIDDISKAGEEIPIEIMTYVDADFFMEYFNFLIKKIKAEVVLIDYVMTRGSFENDYEPVRFISPLDFLLLSFENYVSSGSVVSQEMYDCFSSILQDELDYIKQLERAAKHDVQAKKDLEIMRKILKIMGDHKG